MATRTAPQDLLALKCPSWGRTDVNAARTTWKRVAQKLGDSVGPQPMAWLLAGWGGLTSILLWWHQRVTWLAWLVQQALFSVLGPGLAAPA